MKLTADPSPTFHVVTSLGSGYVAVDAQRHERSLLLQADSLDTDWGPEDYAGLASEHLAPLAGLGCDVVLLGTGNQQRFPGAAILRPLTDARIGVEIMDTPAACRTYNILVAEGRKVAAALIVERAS